MKKRHLTSITHYGGVTRRYYTDGTVEEENVVTIPERIAYLENQHKRIHAEVEKLQKTNPYDASIKDRKTEKLMIKDEIERLTAQYESDSGVEYFR